MDGRGKLVITTATINFLTGSIAHTLCGHHIYVLWSNCKIQSYINNAVLHSNTGILGGIIIAQQVDAMQFYTSTHSSVRTIVEALHWYIQTRAELTSEGNIYNYQIRSAIHQLIYWPSQAESSIKKSLFQMECRYFSYPSNMVHYMASL